LLIERGSILPGGLLRLLVLPMAEHDEAPGRTTSPGPPVGITRAG
jgi:hypothetical protein